MSGKIAVGYTAGDNGDWLITLNAEATGAVLLLCRYVQKRGSLAHSQTVRELQEGVRGAMKSMPGNDEPDISALYDRIMATVEESV
jgi:hypothetical protein